MSGDFTAALQDTDQIEITVTGRVTRKQITVTVWFAAENGTLFLVPVHGSDTDWYKNELVTPELEITAGAASISATATPIADPGRVQEIVGKFRAKYGADQVARFYPKTDVAVEVPLPA